MDIITPNGDRMVASPLLVSRQAPSRASGSIRLPDSFTHVILDPPALITWGSPKPPAGAMNGAPEALGSCWYCYFFFCSTLLSSVKYMVTAPIASAMIHAIKDA